jgi:cytochrome bd-type quinol oxidase subunit 2
MKIFFLALLIAVVAYVVAAVGGYYLISKLSSNTHDKSMEATMTGAFVLGPIAAIIAFIVAYLALRAH